ncbi:MAG: non-ribosomal peptide synthetase, partial [Myxococcales bacterium]|nr:non-ribosomal peptide synthetase [Myxococcales bacterium]
LVAYVVPAPGQRPDPATLRQHVASALPEFMVPAVFVSLDQLPLSSAGKVDRKALPEPAAATRPTAAAPRDDLERTLARLWTEVLGVPEVGLHEPFFDLGGTSLQLAALHDRILDELAVDLRLVDLFAHPTLAALAEHLRGGALTRAVVRTDGPAPGAPIALVGMSCAYPGAPDLERLWQVMVDRVNTVTVGAIRSDGLATELCAGGLLEGGDGFDPRFFGFNETEATWLAPQHRVFLEHAWWALEDAAVDPRRTAARIGVFASASTNTYSLYVAQQTAADPTEGYRAWIMTANEFLGTRVAHSLGLRGPAFSLYAACSSSLVAVHLAAQALRNGDCEMALAGAGNVDLERMRPRVTGEGFLLSPRGRCQPFDAAADGTVFSDGVGVVLLKRLSDALRDGDRVHAVLRGSAVNNDGGRKAGFAAPSIAGQAEVIDAALRDAGVPPETVGYIECHGTGTRLGDPIEIAALREAYAVPEAAPGNCGLGSRKSNFGHPDTAAGVLGLVSTALALKARQRPPTAGFEQLNPGIDFGGT